MTKEILTDIMAKIGWIVTILGCPSALYFIISSIKNRKNISWRSVKKGIKNLVGKIDVIKPDFIITFSGRGAIVASLVATEFDNKYPIYMCLLKRRYNKSFLSPQNWSKFNTSKWIVFVPDEIFIFKDKRILIIDDITNSGETIEELTKHLTNKGIDKENIFSMSLIANEDVLSRLHIPQEYWKKVSISEYNVPWGKTEIK